LIKVFDVHGVVPEEFRLHDDFYNAVFYERMEEIAIRKCNVIVVVTRAMEDYLRQKYRGAVRGQVVLFPMFPNYPAALASHRDSNQKPVIVYAGGIQKWQQVPKMIKVMSQTADLFEYRFYCPEPDKVEAMLPYKIRARVKVDRKTQDELLKLYPECQYGFILREDNIVNRVACPTKLVEYSAMGVVPIVDSENIGDFKAMGMKFVQLDDLLTNSMPNEKQRAEMAKQNLAIYERLNEVYKQGASDIRTLVMDKSRLRGSVKPDLYTRLKNLFPANTRRGLFARKIWMAIRYRRIQSQAENTLLSPLPECEILVQVDNFEAGGLENITLDINEALIRAGHKVVLLVLGTAGISVQRARERGMTVLTGLPRAEWYETLLDRIRPRLVLTHYSTYGADLCNGRNIPFVQTIQNTYMWFDDKQRTIFNEAAKLTTCFLALSEYARQYSVQRLGIDENRCVVLPCGIDCASFDNLDRAQTRHELRSQYGFDEQDFVFLSVGAINHQKNHIATVRAFASQISRLPRAKLIILGPAYEKGLLDEILNFVEEKGLSNRILYAGSAPGAQKYYAMADAFISAAFFEGGPLNLLESLNANLPIVMTNVGLACHFQGIQGVQIIEPAVDIMKFEGKIWELSSTPEFETRLANAILHVYDLPQRPNLSVELLKAFDKSYAYGLYVEKIEALLGEDETRTSTFTPSWINLLAKNTK
jgi:glycosyltransferase involved in cell wall biosynthesis